MSEDEIIEIRELADEMARQNAAPGDQNYLRRGVVTVVTGASASVDIGGSVIPGVPFYAHAHLKPGDAVDVLFDGPAPRIVGAMGSATGAGLLAYAIASTESGGACIGRYPGPWGTGISSVTLSTTKQGLSLGCVGVPVIPGHLLRMRFHFPYAGPVNAGNELYLYMMVAPNGGTWGSVGISTHAPAGVNSPSPEGEFLYVVPDGVTSLNAGLDGSVYTGTASLARYSGTDYRSHFTIEDLGSS